MTASTHEWWFCFCHRSDGWAAASWQVLSAKEFGLVGRKQSGYKPHSGSVQLPYKHILDISIQSKLNRNACPCTMPRCMQKNTSYSSTTIFVCLFLLICSSVQSSLSEQNQFQSPRFQQLSESARLLQHTSLGWNDSSDCSACPLSLKIFIRLPFHSKQFWWMVQLTFLLLKQLIAKIKDMTRAKY